MKLYNTASRQIEEFVPIREENDSVLKADIIENPSVGLYACGPTVYDFSHLGHLRKYVMDDVLVRTLRHVGYDVKYVRNITDVGHLTSDGDTGEDKLEKGSKKYGQSVWDIAERFTEHFHYSMDMMGNLRPDVTAKVTDHIPEQIALVKQLEEKGLAYEIEGDGIYFDTSKFPDYGKMARLDLKNLKEGARLDKVEGRRNPADFALWKFEREGENRQMSWESPWSKRGFPGWHIECSALGIKYLGEQFDVHTGGIDHIPVHHTNEIAQAEGATDKKPFVKYWVHHNFLQVEGEKMSKSLGNFFTIDDVLERGFDPMALRLLYLMSHYRSEQNFTWKNLEGVQKTWEKLKANILKMSDEVGDLDENFDFSSEAESFEQRFFEAMENDLKTPEAVAVMWEMMKSDLSSQEKLELLLEFDEVLGLGFEKILLSEFDDESESDDDFDENEAELPQEVRDLLTLRQEARESKNWQRSDELRDEILELGYEVVDDRGGVVVKRVERA